MELLSEDIKQTSAFVLPKDIVTEKAHKVLVPQTQINELKANNINSFILEFITK